MIPRDDQRPRLSRTYRVREDETVAGPAATPAGVSDAELIRASLAGDQDAFAGLVDRYQKRAFWIAFHVVGRVEESRDVVQEAFVRVYRSLEKFDFSKSFYTWLYRIVMNLAIDALRKLQSSRSVEMEDAESLPSALDGPSTSMEDDERRNLVRATIEKLPPKFRQVIVLRDIQGLSCKEIVPIIKTSHATVRWRLHRARQLFREHWLRVTRKWS